MKSINLFLLFIFCFGVPFSGGILFTQNAQLEIASTKISVDQVEVVKMPILNNEQLQNDEIERRASETGGAPKFAEVFEVNISPLTHGTWETVGATDVWRLRILSKMAYSINLGFSKYVMPDGGKLILYSTDKKNIIGPFTPSDNEEHEQLWTPVLEGEELVIEVQVPGNKRNDLELVLTTVNHDFMNFPAMTVASGSCHLDVICGASDGWEIVDNYRDVIQSVAVISTGGNTFCSGFLVNNTSNECIPYFMTANHCGISSGNAASLVTYWNYENSYCRQPNSSESGNPGNGTLTDFNTGSIFRSSYSASDMTLVELDDPVSETANAFYAGWYNGIVNQIDTVIGIHHPNTDEKRISFEFGTVYVGDYGPTPNSNGNYIVVPDWDVGSTEGGSSGSPLFNKKGRIIGQLRGGDASCNNNQWDAYGAFFRSWEGGGTPSTRLKDWLDPINSGITNLSGRWSGDCYYYVQATPDVQFVCSGSVLDSVVEYEVEISPIFETAVTLSLEGVPAGLSFNFGSNPLLNITTTTLIFSDVQSLNVGQYSMTLIASDGNTEVEYGIILLVEDNSITSNFQPISPLNGSVDVGFWQELLWMFPDSIGVQYHVEVSTESDFNAPFVSEVVDTNRYSFNNPLDPNTLYFWRVRAFNHCSDTGNFSEPFAFLTSNQVCSTYVSADVPKAISGTGTPTITSSLNLPEFGNVTNLRVENLDITHSYISDLIVTLEAPNGNQVTLIDRICDSENNILIGFDQTSTNLYTSISCPPVNGSYYRPFESMIDFNGYQPSGDWILTVSDLVDQDGGNLNSWSLNVCYSSPQEIPAITILHDTEIVCIEDTAMFTIDIASYIPLTDTLVLEIENIPVDMEALYPIHPIANVIGNELMFIPLTGIQAGVYSIPIRLSWSTGHVYDTVSVIVLADSLDQVEISLPVNNQLDVLLDPVFSWNSVMGNEISYLFELSSTVSFDTIVYSNYFNDTTYTVSSSLDPNVTYFWRVKALSDCAEGSYSNTFSFTTAQITACLSVMSNDTITISPAEPSMVTSTVHFPEYGNVLDVNVSNIDITHAYVWDLEIFLESPDGTTVMLIDNICSLNNDLNMGLDQDAPSNYNTIPCPPTDGNSYVPIESLNNVSGEEAFGDWILTVSDVYFGDGGSLNSWSLEVCYQQSVLVSKENIKVEVKDYPLSIYPNPAQNLLYIKYLTALTEPVDINIIDISGRVMKSYNSFLAINGENNWQLDISNLSSGYYFISLCRNAQYQQELPFAKIENK